MSSMQPTARQIWDYRSDPSKREPVPWEFGLNSTRLQESHSYAAGVELFHQGADAHDVYFLQRGLFKLIRSEDNGQEVLLDLKFPGSLIGAAAAILSRPHPFCGDYNHTLPRDLLGLSAVSRSPGRRFRFSAC